MYNKLSIVIVDLWVVKTAIQVPLWRRSCRNETMRSDEAGIVNDGITSGASVPKIVESYEEEKSVVRTDMFS